MLQDHYSTTLTLHSVLSCVIGAMVILAVAPPLTPHLAAYVLIFWAGAGLLAYVGLSQYLSATLTSIQGDLTYIYFIFII